jgi:uncharacterized protein (TIGR02118 family)
MIKVGVFYPHSQGSKFDMKYYLEKHIPLVRQKVGPALKSVAVEQGLAGGAPGTPMTYVAMCHLLFDSVDAFHGRYSQLHEHPAHHSDQRSENLAVSAWLVRAIQRRRAGRLAD